ncbi:MAG TPA: hypothetical protein VFE47_05905 [Tepidisphaeraceae bacterium]|nr:hypothetical protein [Tepidisphaeraceae bacterium]
MLAIGAAYSFTLHEPLDRKLETTDWYRYRPTRWVLQDLKTGTGKPVPGYTMQFSGIIMRHGWVREEPDLARVALNELLKREKNGQLSRSERDQIFDQAIQAEWQRDETPVQYYLFEYVGRRVSSGDVTHEQIERFYQPVFSPKLRARAHVCDGDKVPVEFTRLHALGGDTNWVPTCTYVRAEIDGKEVEFRSEPQNDSLGFRELRLLPPSPIGLHAVTLCVTLTVSDANLAPVRVRQLHLSAPFEVVARTPANCVQFNHPVADAQMNAWAKSSPHVWYSQMGARACFSLDIWDPTPAQPADAAFDVFARYAGKEHRIGQWAARAGPDPSMGRIPFTPTVGVSKPAPIIDLIFRPSREAATNTVDLTDIWDKDILVKNVKVNFTL